MNVGQIALAFPKSAFVPVVLGFFGLGTGYLIYGPQELFRAPGRNASVDRASGIWGIWMPGFCQLLTGVYLFVGLTWFKVFDEKPLYMAALAFSAYGIHWFALGWNRYQQNDPRPNGGMSIAFTILSVLGAFVFFNVGSWPVGVLFVGLAGVYISEFFASVDLVAPATEGTTPLKASGERALGLFHTATGLWLMYLTVATTLTSRAISTYPAAELDTARRRPSSPSSVPTTSSPRTTPYTTGEWAWNHRKLGGGRRTPVCRRCRLPGAGRTQRRRE